jgi:hypothetical protein
MRRLLGSFALLTLALAACKNTTSLAGSGGDAGDGGTGGAGATGGGGTGGGGPLSKVTKVDILFGIDNSRSMADKQEILALALDDLISGLADPPCLDAAGNYVAQPGPLTPCPPDSQRRFHPVSDIHIGIVSSSLGGHGADTCAVTGPDTATNNDRARLLDRVDPLTDEEVPTWQDKGFLAWDPAQSLVPPGQGDEATLVQQFKDMVLGVGQIGCGYEAQLESLYRFLVEPDPPETVTLDQGMVVWQGTDDVLLDQRRSFLRPDSMLVVVSMSDENDCSIREEGQYHLVAQAKGPGGAPFHLPRARSICETDPMNACCASCGQATPDGCPEDPLCKDGNGQTTFLDDETDNINQRCFDQRRRFGIDFLYPVSRYIDGFTAGAVTDRSGQVVPNPVFSDLDPSDGAQPVRDPGLVIVTGIVGVPWQDIAKNYQDLKQGFKTAGELTQENINGHTVWDIILGDPDNSVPPLDPFMVESIFPRSGVNPVTGDATTLAGFWNPINGHEFPNPMQDDLQYACIMPVPTPRDCTDPFQTSCDCLEPDNENPLCAENPADGGNPTLQVSAKAMPGLRQLAVLRGLGERAVIGSICAGQLDDPTLPDYAYRPAVASLIDRMKGRLQ